MIKQQIRKSAFIMKCLALYAWCYQVFQWGISESDDTHLHHISNMPILGNYKVKYRLLHEYGYLRHSEGL